MTKKVVIYTRVSTLDQTIDNQLLELRDHCSKMGSVSHTHLTLPTNREV